MARSVSFTSASGGFEGRLYLDLGDKSWRAVEIDTAGWRVVQDPPVRFRRAAGMQPLPEPVRGGSIDALREFLNVASEADFVLAVGWLFAVLREHGPYPVLVLTGEQGSAKSTFTRIMRGLVDPNTAALRSLPRSDRDLFIAANNGYVIAFDNVSGLPVWLSDTLCRLATGGGFATRQLYTDQDEVLFDSTRPSIANGIEDFVTRPDLADRALLLILKPIAEQDRRSEKELWTKFEAKRPLILGALLDAVVHGIGQLPHIHPLTLPRMADFALWVTACEGAFWPPGTFLAAYASNRDVAVQVSIDADPVASAVRALMVDRAEWSGTATALLGVLREQSGEQAQKSKAWPDSPQGLANRLRRAATFLRAVGIEIVFGREGRARTRIIRITTPDAGQQPSASSASSAGAGKTNGTNDFADACARTAGHPADDTAAAAAASVRTNPLKTKGADDADGADAAGPISKVGWKCPL